jgi:hypothetical protein
MEGTGIFALFGMLALAPFQLIGAVVGMVRAHAQRRRYLSPHELNLRRASHPLGVAAVLFAAHWLYGARVRDGLVALPLDGWVLVALCGVVFVFGAASFVSGAGRCAGLRDGMLATRAFFKLAGGAVICAYVWRLPLWRAYLDASLFPYLAPPVFFIGLWCLVTGAVRMLLLLVPMQGAFDLVWRRIKRDDDESRWWDDDR